MTPSELLVKRALDAKGWTVIHRGWPDFFVFRDKVLVGEVERSCFCVEVKTGTDRPSDHQRAVHKLLKGLGVPVHVVNPDNASAMKVLKGECGVMLFGKTQHERLRDRLTGLERDFNTLRHQVEESYLLFGEDSCPPACS
jgi:hypothetical protein